MKAPCSAPAAHLACPDVQSVWLLAVQLHFFKTLLNPLPVVLVFFLCYTGNVWGLLPVALADSRRDEEDRVFDGVYQRFGVIHDDAMRQDALGEPLHEVLT